MGGMVFFLMMTSGQVHLLASVGCHIDLEDWCACCQESDSGKGFNRLVEAVTGRVEHPVIVLDKRRAVGLHRRVMTSFQED